MKLSSVLNTFRTVPVTFGEESVEVQYYPNKLTPELLKILDEAGKEAPLRQIEVMVKSWDIQDDDGKNVLPTMDVISKMPIEFLTSVLTQIDQDIRGWSKDQKK